RGFLPAISLLAASAIGAGVARAQSGVADASSPLPGQLSLDHALQIFRSYGIDLLIAEAQIRVAEGDIRAAGAVPNPNFAVGAYRSFSNPPASAPAQAFETLYGGYIGIGDSNALEDSLSGKRHLRLKVARAALAAAKLSRQDAERMLTFQVK